MSVTVCQYWSLAVRHAPAAPVIGSAMNAGDRVGAFALDDLDQGVGVVPRHVREVEEHRLEAGLAGVVTAHGERRHRQPVIAGMASDHLPPIRATLAELVAAGQTRAESVLSLPPLVKKTCVNPSGSQRSTSRSRSSRRCSLGQIGTEYAPFSIAA